MYGRAPAGVKDAASGCSGERAALRMEALGRLFAARKPATCARPAPHALDPMRALLDVVLLVLQIYVWLLIAAAILSWLIAFGVVNTRNQAVAMIGEFLYRITEPALRPIRAVLPNLGGIDISPVILILIIYFIQEVIVRYIYPYVF